GVERTLEAKAANVLVCLEEGILINVLRVVLGAGEMQRQPQHRLVVVPHQLLEGSAVAALRLADQYRIVDAAFLPSHAVPRRGILVTADSLHSLVLAF